MKKDEMSRDRVEVDSIIESLEDDDELFIKLKKEHKHQIKLIVERSRDRANKIKSLYDNMKSIADEILQIRNEDDFDYETNITNIISNFTDNKEFAKDTAMFTINEYTVPCDCKIKTTNFILLCEQLIREHKYKD